jgi:hypothetical protein
MESVEVSRDGVGEGLRAQVLLVAAGGRLGELLRVEALEEICGRRGHRRAHCSM